MWNLPGIKNNTQNGALPIGASKILPPVLALLWDDIATLK
jgi:hypothetical protein